jgi:ribosomal protein S18 acetylase RimI-like enzyme
MITSTKIQRFYLKINSLKDLIKSNYISSELKITLEKNKEINFYKFLYKEIGKDFFWKDRLKWTDNNWFNYLNSIDFYVLKNKENIVGFYELLFNKDINSSEISYLGIFKEYYNKGIGGYLLTDAIIRAFQKQVNQVIIHTCTLDHPNALKNYIARGMKIYKIEEIYYNPENL